MVFSAALALTVSCAPTIRPTLDRPPTAKEIQQLWVQPEDITARDLVWGVGGKRCAPDPDAVYTFVEEKKGGFSPGYDVKDPEGHTWKVKMGPEAGPEVVASRLFWAIGYHQPPIYHLAEWRLDGGPDPGVQEGGRFREVLDTLEKGEDWSWHRNPFVGTRPYRGLIVLNAMLNNSDLKTDNNSIYEAGDEWPQPGRWFVVRDIGHSFGRTGIMHGTRGDLDGFLEHGFITWFDDEHVDFEWHGRHHDLLNDITPEDVRWTADLLAQLTDRQWEDAFAAGGYEGKGARAFIARMKEKIARAQSLPRSTD